MNLNSTPNFVPHAAPPFGQPPYTQPPQKQRYHYTGKQFYCALFSLLCGYLFCRAFPFSDFPMGAALFLLLLTAGSAVFLLSERKKLPKREWTAGGRIADLLFPLFLTLFSLSPLLQSGIGMRFLSSLLYFVLLFYYLGMSGGYCFESGRYPGELFLFDGVKSLIIMPLGCAGLLFPALFSGRRQKTASTAPENGSAGGKKKRGTLRLLLLILGGLCISLLPTLLVGVLLSYDDGFRGLLEGIFSCSPDLSFLFSHLGSLILGIPLAMLLFSSFFSLMTGRHRELLRKEFCDSTRRQTKFLPVPMSSAVYLPPLLLYLLFFFSQKDYYLSAFTGKLPDGFVFASYAREGFFNLCIVAAINAVLLLGVSLFTRKRHDGSRTLPERVGAILLSLATLLLITTAMAKLVMYISVYGFSLLRLLAAWAMLLLFTAFLSVIAAQFFGRLRLTSLLLTVFLLFTGALCTVDLKAVTANYNAEAYISGSIKGADLQSIADLGESGIPALVRLAEAGVKDQNGSSAIKILINTDFYRTLLMEEDETSFFSDSIPRRKAKKAMERIREDADAAYRQMLEGVSYS